VQLAAPLRPLARFGAAWIALLGIALCLVAWTIQVAPRQYTATAVVSVVPRDGEAPPAASMITLLAKTYVAFASSDQTAEKISAETGLPVGDVQDAIKVTMAPNTTNVEVNATVGNPGQAALVAGSLSNLLVTFSQYDSTLTASTVVPATPPLHPELDGVRPLVVQGLLVLGVVAIAAALLVRLSRRPGRA
jgi:capsular polysaccharide biosynthesis protein